MNLLPFSNLQEKVSTQWEKMCKGKLFTISNIDPDEFYNLYLDSFPEGTNNMFRERREYDCNCCKSFLKHTSNIISIDELGQVTTLWDFPIGGQFEVVVDALRQKVYENLQNIDAPFYTERSFFGGKPNVDNYDLGHVWSHFYVEVPIEFQVPEDVLASKLGKLRSSYRVFFRAVAEIAPEAVESVLDLIEDNNLLRGLEYKHVLQNFKDFSLQGNIFKDTLEMYKVVESNLTLAHIRNSVIGTLLVDLSEGVELDDAVFKYESKVDPANFKRPRKVVTPAQIKKAQKRFSELGLEGAEKRRHAVNSDVPITDVLFADNATVVKMKGGFDILLDETVGTFDGYFHDKGDISIENFLKFLPSVKSMAALLSNSLSNNLMSVVAPVDEDCGNMLKWDNNFSWAYNNDLADSAITRRVKSAGGSVEGELRVSLSWDYSDDLDLHCIVLDGRGKHVEHIFFGNKKGVLDVDANAGYISESPVENMIFKSLQEGYTYIFGVQNYNQRQNLKTGFDIEVAYEGSLSNLSYPSKVGEHKDIRVCKVYKKAGKITFESDLKYGVSSMDVWGISTEKFHKVTMLMNSPNYWREGATGNKHWFFILEDCRNPEECRGFFPEYLRTELHEDRKVFEALGSKMKVPYSDEQLSGLGFSSTVRKDLVVRVTTNEGSKQQYTIKF